MGLAAPVLPPKRCGLSHDAAVMRRFVLVVGLSVLLVLGFGAAYAVSGALNGTSLLSALTGHTPVTVCHKRKT